MLSQGKMIAANRRISKFDREKLDTPITVRVIFQKTGNLQYFSHLDLQRTWQRVLVRASIPMWYTQGFNPHSKIVFGVPLPVGSEGMEEMVDLRIDRQITPAEIKAQLNAELTSEMQVSEVYIPTAPFSDIAWGVYQMTLKTPGSPTDVANAINAMFAPDAEPVVMTKRSKSGVKNTFSFSPLIFSDQAFRRSFPDAVFYTELNIAHIGTFQSETIIALPFPFCVVINRGFGIKCLSSDFYGKTFVIIFHGKNSNIFSIR